MEQSRDEVTRQQNVRAGGDAYVAGRDLFLGTGPDEHVLAGAVTVGSAFAMRNTYPDSPEARFLMISDELRSATDVNDSFGITHALKTRWGHSASESFLLGRQLTLVLGSPELSSTEETRSLILSRLRLRTRDDELTEAVGGVLSVAVQKGSEAASDRTRFLGQLLLHVSSLTTTDQARQTRAQLLQGNAAHGEPGTEEDTGRRFLDALEVLVAAGIHRTDPDVLLFLAVVRDDSNMLREALDKGGNPATLDTEIMSRYHHIVAAAD